MVHVKVCVLTTRLPLYLSALFLSVLIRPSCGYTSHLCPLCSNRCPLVSCELEGAEIEGAWWEVAAFVLLLFKTFEFYGADIDPVSIFLTTNEERKCGFPGWSSYQLIREFILIWLHKKSDLLGKEQAIFLHAAVFEM